VTKPANPKIADLSVIYTLNLLEQKPPSLRQLHANGDLPCTPTYAAKQLGTDLHPGRTESLARARNTPENAFLAVDLVVVEHPGSNIEGVDLVYASSAKRAVLAHAFVSSGLVYANKAHDPIPYRLEPFLTSALATEEYPHRTPGVAFVETVTQAGTDGVKFQAALVDVQFTDQITLGQLRRCGGMRFADRLEVLERRSLDLCVLISTLEGLGVQTLLAAWKARWYRGAWRTVSTCDLRSDCVRKQMI
jgi:hypothetical protein